MPKVVPFSFGQNPVQEGTSTTLQCTVSEGDLPIDIIWHFNDTVIENSDFITTSRLGRRVNILNIEEISTTNAGKYTCLANNSAGSDNFSADLLVNGCITVFFVILY